jgi:hypothetical protein
MIKILKRLLNLKDEISNDNIENNYLPINQVILLHKYKLATFLIDEIGIEYSKEDAYNMINIVNNKHFLKRSLDICNININDIVNIIKNFDNPLIFELGFNLQNLNNLYNGKTLLMYCIENLRYKTIIYLINNKIDVNKKDINNNDCGYYLYNFINNNNDKELKLEKINKIYLILKRKKININYNYGLFTLKEQINKLNKIEFEYDNNEQVEENILLHLSDN